MCCLRTTLTYNNGHVPHVHTYLSLSVRIGLPGRQLLIIIRRDGNYKLLFTGMLVLICSGRRICFLLLRYPLAMSPGWCISPASIPHCCVTRMVQHVCFDILILGFQWCREHVELQQTIEATIGIPYHIHRQSSIISILARI